jgi:hypothetical protein
LSLEKRLSERLFDVGSGEGNSGSVSRASDDSLRGESGRSKILNRKEKRKRKKEKLLSKGKQSEKI